MERNSIISIDEKNFNSPTWWNTADKPSQVKLRESQFGLSHLHCIGILQILQNIAHCTRDWSLLHFGILRTLHSRMCTDMRWLVFEKDDSATVTYKCAHNEIHSTHSAVLTIENNMILSRSLVYAQCAQYSCSCSVLPAKLSLREVKDGPTSVLTAASADFDKGENGVALVISMFFPVVFVIFLLSCKRRKIKLC